MNSPGVCAAEQTEPHFLMIWHPGVYGDDLRLQLTLDARLQELAAKALAAQVTKWKAQKGRHRDGCHQWRTAGVGVNADLRPQSLLAFCTGSVP